MPVPMITLQATHTGGYEVTDLNGHTRLLDDLTTAASWAEQGCPDYEPTYRAERKLTRYVRTADGSRPEHQWLIICNDTNERIGTFPDDDEARAKAWAAAGCKKTNNPLTWDHWYKDKIRADAVRPGDLIMSPWGSRSVLEVDEPPHHDTFTNAHGETSPRVRFTGWENRPGTAESIRVEKGWAQKPAEHMYLMGDLRDVKSYE